MPFLRPLAQRLEQETHNLLVAGSNPAGPTNLYTKKSDSKGRTFFVLEQKVCWSFIWQRTFDNSQR